MSKQTPRRSRPHMTGRALLMDAVCRDALAEGIVDLVLRLYEAGESWRKIALRLHDVTGMRVTHETVRGWALEWMHHRERGRGAA